ncbi:MAG: hypothetical protein ACRD82_17360 [Blastocatellia bacterium]
MTVSDAPARQDKPSLSADKAASVRGRGFQTLQRLPLPAICGGIFLLALVVRIGLAVALNLHATPRNTEFERIALTLAATGVFGDPYRIPTGPTAHHAPLYPLVLSWLYSLFGMGANGRLAQVLFNSGAASLQYALLPVAAAMGQLKRHIGILAGLVGALVPLHLLIEINSMESLAGVALIGLFLLTLRTWQAEPSWRAALMHGLGWGLALLLTPALLPVFVALSLAGYFLAGKRASWFQHTLLTCCWAAVTLVPWTARNYVQFDALFFVRNNLGLELSVSNNDFARAAIDDNEKSGAYRNHPFSNQAEAERVKEMGEIAYHREKMQEAQRWIKAHPLRFARLTALRLFYFWFPKTTRPAQTILLWTLTVLSGAGLWQLFRINRAMAWGIALIWVSFPLAYYLLQASARYRFPIHWTFLLLAALATGNFLAEINVRNRWNIRL